MSKSNFKHGDCVVLNTSYQMIGYGKLPTEWSCEIPMIVDKKCRSGEYLCIVPNKRYSVPLPKRFLTLWNDNERR